MDRTTVLGKIATLSEKHILKRSPERYVEGFVDALIKVYPAKSLEYMLQQKFHIPDETSYSDKHFCELACELTVANHLKLTGAPNFEAEKKLNPGSDKDVDAYCDIGAYHLAVEVKCPELKIPKNNSPNPVVQINFVGRPPDYQQQFEDLRDPAGPKLPMEMGKRDDNKLKDYLTAAHDKFRKPSQPGDANVLFVALDDYYTMYQWNGYLFANQGGFFGSNPYVEREKFQQVDVVILSNLQSAHMIGRDYHDWTLKDIYMIPRITQNPRPGLDDHTAAAALRLFPHELRGFSTFQPYTGTDLTHWTVAQFTKIAHYAIDVLSEADKKRYFPVQTSTMKSTSEATETARRQRQKAN